MIQLANEPRAKIEAVISDDELRALDAYWRA
jgi:hypothetical protein